MMTLKKKTIVLDATLTMRLALANRAIPHGSGGLISASLLSA
jgi:hypothetical protein